MPEGSQGISTLVGLLGWLYHQLPEEMSPIGYDMFTVLPMNAEDQAAYETATTAFHEAVKAQSALPDGEGGVDAASAEMDRRHRSNFRLNIGGMSLFADLMSAFGMLMGRNAEAPPWPDADGLDDNDADAAYDLREERLKDMAVRYGSRTGTDALKDEKPSTETVSKAVSDYADRELFKLLWVPQPVTGIYVDKFSSNDGWVVTPVEIRAALETYRKCPGETVARGLGRAGLSEYRVQRWYEWIDFLEYAGEHGGFTVY